MPAEQNEETIQEGIRRVQAWQHGDERELESFIINNLTSKGSWYLRMGLSKSVSEEQIRRLMIRALSQP